MTHIPVSLFLTKMLEPVMQMHGTEEVCAVIFERDLPGHALNPREYRLAFVQNQHEDPENHYRIVQSDVEAAQIDGERLWAVVHTHPRANEAEPSYDDVKTLPNGLYGVVVHPRSRSWTLYNNKVGVLAFLDGSKK